MLPPRKEGRIISKVTERRQLKKCYELSKSKAGGMGKMKCGALPLVSGSGSSKFLKAMASQTRLEAQVKLDTFFFTMFMVLKESLWKS